MAVLRQRLPAPSPEDRMLGVEARGAEAELADDPLAMGLPETTRRALANARVGQGGYRARMLRLWGAKCAATGCAVERVLVASHAQPWATCSNHARLDEYNGLLLAASVDRLFDAGLIAFRDDGRLLVSDALDDGALACVGLARDARVLLKPRHLPYIRQHRETHGFG
ncbi:HNH endonuclease [Variovorax sp. PAMC26660]|nr:HNH endonuclease [Variovorax sp. PAMC26660]